MLFEWREITGHSDCQVKKEFGVLYFPKFKIEIIR